MKKNTLGSTEVRNERDYIKNAVGLFNIRNGEQFDMSICDHWKEQSDFQTKMNRLVLDYILENFTFKELYEIFYYADWDCLFEPEEIHEFRRHAIELINDSLAFTKEEAKKLKRKVWDTNPIVFALMQKLIREANIIIDEDGVDMYPDFKEYMSFDRTLMFREH